MLNTEQHFGGDADGDGVSSPCARLAHQSSGLAQIPLKPLESPRVYQAPGSAVQGWVTAVVRSQPGGEDRYCEGAWRAGSHSATETLCLCMERSALISRLY
ncbi:hypothetical protein EYF80_002692 [Liparis tanakae]|uniref:Uncharacterized protein n=1 Tax=Liparis tanakae TaxID=230148 RepID=A0A4Z2JA67_9TELE|nr:hypothetical protein EYF80_002692 [Liparis tanakae]